MRSFLRPTLIFWLIVIFPQSCFAAMAMGIRSEEGGDSVLVDIQKLIHEADSLAKAYQLDTAIALGEFALESARKEFGESDTTTASAMSVLGNCFYKQVHYAQCESLWRKALAIREEKMNADDPRIASSLNDLGTLCCSRAKHDEAEALFKRALAIREKAFGPEHPYVASVLDNLAILYRQQGAYGEAVSLCRRALAIREKALAPEHPDVAVSLDRLATLYLIRGELNEAEPLYKRAVRISAKALGPEHPNVALSLNKLAILYREEGKYIEAEPLFAQVLAMREKTLGPEHPDVAISMRHLAILYTQQGEYIKAEFLLKEALAMQEKLLGSEHPDVALSLNKLATIYLDQGKAYEAELLYKRALHISEKALGPKHPNIGFSLDQLATLYQAQGKASEAEPLLKRALAIREQPMGPDHPYVAENLRQLARAYCAMGEAAEALANYMKLQEARENFIEYVFSNASEEQKMRYLEKYPLIDQSLLSFAVLHPSSEAKRTAIDVVLRGKASVIHAVAAEKEIAYCSYDDEILKKAERHSEVCGEIATLALAGAENLDSEIYRARLEALYSTKDSLETELSSICSEFEEEMASRRFGIDDIAEALPPGAVLWEFLRYEPFDFTKVGSEKERIGPPRYLAFTLDRTGDIDITDLGVAEEIDSLIALTRKRIYRARGEVFSASLLESERSLAQVTGELYARIFAPLEKSIADGGYIFISPDGQLNLLPFEILPCPDGGFVVEKFRVSYLSSGRDLLGFKRRHEPSDWALLMADPDFDLSEEALARHREKTEMNAEVLSSLFEPSRGASECLESEFDLLPYSRREIESVESTLEKKQLRIEFYDRGDALEEVVKGMETPPRILHLATHGYFCEDVAGEKMLENPLLRSGLALAGANRSRDGTAQETGQGDDGILTAFEVSGLDLVGTELATLSACETGVGEVKNGEGVYGLRRAFQHAGARAILMSLWKMPDREIYSLMDNFYRNWSDGETKQEALRQATLKLIGDLRDKYGTAHPLLWGGFVLAGNPN